MSFDAFLKLDGIKGESADSKHKGEIDLIGITWGVTQGGSSATGGGGGAGKAQFQDVHCSKQVDSASPVLMLACASGLHIREGLITVRKAGGEQLEYLKVKLSDLLISHVTPHGTPGNKGDELLHEEISLNFSKIEVLYQPQGADGKAQGGPVMAGWDVKANKKV